MVKIEDVVRELTAERDQLNRAIDALSSLEAGGAQSPANGRGTRTLSPAARRRIASAQRARWAKFKSTKDKSTSSVARQRVVSTAARRKMAAAQRARWAKVRAEQTKKAA
jgi:hypothetical protein